MYVKELWRYPVKSLAGERLERARVGELGIDGDRVVLVVGRGGRIVTSRSHPHLLGLQGTLGEEGQPRINGLAWDDPAALELVQAAAGPDVRMVRCDGPERFDILPLSIATDGAIEHMGFDGRRLRPNLVIGGVEGLAERGWPGKRLRVGELLVDIQRLRPRCVMTTFDPDTQAQDVTVLKRIGAELDGTMSLDSSVARPGEIQVGDQVELLG